MELTQFASIAGVHPPGFSTGSPIGCAAVSDFQQGEIGPELFRKAREFGLEGLVSKRVEAP